MRLITDEIKAIKTVIKKKDPHAIIYLFGSRVDDTKRGGDIDLLLLSPTLSERDKREIRKDLCNLLGDQKIDIIIADNDKKPLVRIALHDGIPL